MPIARFADADEWQRWLREHHDRSAGVWLQIAKKGTGVSTVSFLEALDEALCFGWIDGQKRGLDETFFLQRFTPRGPRSNWSQINRSKVTELIDAGRMRPPGRAKIDAAKADGRWDAAYEPQSRATVPEDLQRALDEHPAAQRFFATLTGSTRYAFLYRLHHVRSADARARRIAAYIELLEQERTLG